MAPMKSAMASSAAVESARISPGSAEPSGIVIAGSELRRAVFAMRSAAVCYAFTQRPQRALGSMRDLRSFARRVAEVSNLVVIFLGTLSLLLDHFADIARQALL